MEDVVMPRSASCCRSCGATLSVTFVDLGMSPLANSFVAAEDLHRAECIYPLHVYVCANCFLVQLEEFESPEHIFSDYLYFSSFSDSWLAHCRDYAAMATRRFALGAASKVVEIASNDGYLLQYFVAQGIPVLGVDPAANVAAAALARGVPTEIAFFGRETASRLVREGHAADLIAANNVLAHVPDINDFVAGFAVLLRHAGVATFEFPHLLELMAQNQFDTIYHEHFSYLSFMVVRRILAAHGLHAFDVESLPTHGGSLRVFACHDGAPYPTEASVELMLGRERDAGLDRIETYAAFAEGVIATKLDLLSFLIGARRQGLAVVGYGAPAKGNTLLNFCGVGPELLAYTTDRSTHKQGRYLPKTRIPILAPEAIARTRPDYVLILPWNIKDEIIASLPQVRGWGGRFVTPIPTVRIEE
jgi:SAM-dependent methyltransferase